MTSASDFSAASTSCFDESTTAETDIAVADLVLQGRALRIQAAGQTARNLLEIAGRIAADLAPQRSDAALIDEVSDAIRDRVTGHVSCDYRVSVGALARTVCNDGLCSGSPLSGVRGPRDVARPDSVAVAQRITGEPGKPNPRSVMTATVRARTAVIADRLATAVVDTDDRTAARLVVAAGAFATLTTADGLTIGINSPMAI